LSNGAVLPASLLDLSTEAKGSNNTSAQFAADKISNLLNTNPGQAGLLARGRLDALRLRMRPRLAAGTVDRGAPMVLHISPEALGPGGQLPGGTGTERLRQMERAKCFLISLCRGMASLRPVCGLLQIEWLPPSRTGRQPFSCRWPSKARRFMPAKVPPSLPVGPDGRLLPARCPAEVEPPGPGCADIHPWFHPVHWPRALPDRSPRNRLRPAPPDE